VSMARLAGRVIERPPAESSQSSAPARPATQAPRRIGAQAPVSELDSLLAQIVDESPAPRPRPAPRPAPAAEPVAPTRQDARASRRLPWRAIGLGVLSTAALMAVAFAPRLRGLIAGPAVRFDGTPAPAPTTGFDAWLQATGGGEGYIL